MVEPVTTLSGRVSTRVYDPDWEGEVPWCSYRDCPQYDGKRCAAAGEEFPEYDGPHVCLPEVIQMRRVIDNVVRHVGGYIND